MVLAGRYQKRAIWWLVFLAALSPSVWIIYKALFGLLGADPAKEIVDFLGLWGLRFLLITLSVTTLRVWFGVRWLISFKRMLGLFCFYYVVLHLLGTLTFLMGWRLDLFVKEVTERPYIILGVVAFLMLLPLAVTSTKGWQLRLGRNWKRVHRFVYTASFFAVMHLVLLIRASYWEATLYSLLLLILLGQRLATKFNGVNWQRSA
jgi:sulfoxide reductase heme-binding subunit YedZ